ncbi:uncharacterized protein LOC114524169 [Dendronephthya gigantea]|uniref:uncharacterized protein LOC114524169 n=1 Tax=Dendronephthya gigantea TaxID=151771 RepID=UPI001069E13C|nr:uncharacterized protein LOC114524169 [Dendronephthya gigantea]
MHASKVISNIDECIAGNYSCGANSRCVNVPGNYSCPCVNGFGILPTNNSCKDIDECNPSSGYIHGCQMKCNNFVGGYRCSCNRGFNLTSNGKNCSDHDECEGNVHGCEQHCINWPGGYTCSCSRGYRLNTDVKTCSEINECLENISGCAQDCTNTIGGFNCSCRKGYFLGTDQTSCIDIDECSKQVDYCHHICSNTPGSYKCSCRAGFDLRLDRKSCIGRPCFPLHKPLNGIKNCTGYWTDDRCNFGCLHGYNLIGSVDRTCGSNKQWTGNDTECKITHCVNPKRPSNGFVYSPCSTHYGSKCSLGCNDGYRIDTDVITCDANGLWQPTNVSCKEIEVCRPNPCFHEGKCSIVNEDSYKCDCSSTGYKGTNCEIAFFTIFEYPTILPNVVSPPITIIALQPTNQVILHLINRNLDFTPSVLVFHSNSSLNQSVTVKAKKEGLYFIKYSLSGPSAGEYSLPEEDTLFVSSPKNSTDTFQMGNNIFPFPAGCHKKQIGVVHGSKLPIVVSSTSSFVSFGPLSVTEGIVSIYVSNSSKLPLSLVGLNLPNTSIISDATTCVDNDVVLYSIGSLLRSRVLAKSFIDAIKNSLPSWIKITLSEANSVKTMYSSEKKTYFLNGKNMRTASIGKGLPVVDESFYSMLSTNNLNITVENNTDIFKSNPIALAVELDGKLPSNISKNNSIERPKKNGFWDGDKFFNVKSSSDGTFAAVTSLEKHFKNTTFAADLRMQFDGTIITHVENINKILDSPLYQQWDVDLYGKISLTILFQMQGKTVNLRFKRQESVNYAGFGDSNEIHQGKKGFFLRTIMEKDPFLNTSFETFLYMSANRTISCFLDTNLYKEKNSFHHVEVSNGLSCVFRGNLRIGDLKFQPMQLNLFMGRPLRNNNNAESANKSTDESVHLIGSCAESKNETFGIFKPYPDYCLGKIKSSMLRVDLKETKMEPILRLR